MGQCRRSLCRLTARSQHPTLNARYSSRSLSAQHPPERLVVDYDAVPEQGQRHGRREHQRGSVVDHPDLGGWRETQKCACSKGKFPPQGDSDLLFMILLRYDVELVYLTDYFVKVHLEELREVEIMLVLVS